MAILKIKFFILNLRFDQIRCSGNIKNEDLEFVLIKTLEKQTYMLKFELSIYDVSFQIKNKPI